MEIKRNISQKPRNYKKNFTNISHPLIGKYSHIIDDEEI